MIKVYSKDGCGNCAFVMKYLDSKDVKYTEINISNDEKGMEEVKELGFLSVPITVVDGMEPIVGFNLPKLKDL